MEKFSFLTAMIMTWHLKNQCVNWGDLLWFNKVRLKKKNGRKNVDRWMSEWHKCIFWKKMSWNDVTVLKLNQPIAIFTREVCTVSSCCLLLNYLYTEHFEAKNSAVFEIAWFMAKYGFFNLIRYLKCSF